MSRFVSVSIDDGDAKDTIPASESLAFLDIEHGENHERSSESFDALVTEFLRGYPLTGHALSDANAQYVAGRLLVLEAKGNAASSSETWPDGAGLRLAACLFVLFVQENLVHNRQHILGTDVQEIYVIMHQLINKIPIAYEAFVRAVEAVDSVGVATNLLHQQEVTNALFASEELSAFWASDARCALEAIDEADVLTEYGAAATMESANPAQVVMEPTPLPQAVPVGSELQLVPLPTALAARPRVRSLTGAMAFGGLLLGVGALVPTLLKGPNSSVDMVGIIGRDNCTTTGCLPETSLVPLIFISLSLLMLLARPSDRSRVTLRRLCIGVAIIPIAGGISSARRMVATYRSASGYWVGADFVEVLYRLQPVEATLLFLISILLLGHTVYVYCKHTSGARPRRTSGRLNEVPQMHAALSSMWRSVRLACLCTGISFFGFNALRVCIRVSRVDSFQGRGYYIDALVGVVLIVFSAAITPRQRLRLQLSRLSSATSLCCSCARLGQPSAKLPSPETGVINLAELSSSAATLRSLGSRRDPHPPMAAPLDPKALPAALPGGLHLQREIGRGSTAVVFAGAWPAAGQFAELRVAVKVLAAPAGMPPAVLDRLATEVRIAVSLHHEHVCATLGVASIADKDSAADKCPILVLELVEGGTLEQLLRLRSAANAPTTAASPGSSAAERVQVVVPVVGPAVARRDDVKDVLIALARRAIEQTRV